jgi:protease-4
MSTLRVILDGIWRGLDGLRKVLHLLLLVVIFGAIIWAVSSSVPSVPQRAALVIRPQGRLVEQLSGDPVQRAIQNARGQARQETSLWDLAHAVRAAASDRPAASPSSPTARPSIRTSTTSPRRRRRSISIRPAT